MATFFLTAAEHSGDALGAALIGALRQSHPEARFVGVGGEKMAAAGCRLLADPTARSAMLTGALGQVGYWWSLLKKIRQELTDLRPDVVIPIDSPTINLRIAALAKKMNLPVCYYVAPQLWAWAPWRMARLRRSVDRVCCVLPFEEAYFQRHQVPAVYVGHPMFDQPPSSPLSDPARLESPLPGLLTACDDPRWEPRLALLPGSRSAEIEANFPAMLEALSEVKARYPRLQAVVAGASEERAWQIRHHLRRSNSAVELRVGCTDAIIRWSDIVLVVSGTATLQVAKYGKPMVILYGLARWKWQLLGRWLIQTPHLSLVNILAGRELVPEHMPYHGPPQVLARDLLELLEHPRQREEMSRQLGTLVAGLAPSVVGQTAAWKVAQQVLGLL